jgi:hypothetical protein
MYEPISERIIDLNAGVTCEKLGLTCGKPVENPSAK